MINKIDDIAFIVQARLNSQRVPRKMIKPFSDTNLFGLILDKLLSSEVIPSENIKLIPKAIIDGFQLF